MYIVGIILVDKIKNNYTNYSKYLELTYKKKKQRKTIMQIVLPKQGEWVYYDLLEMGHGWS